MPSFLESRGFLSEDAASIALDKSVRTLKRWRQLGIGPAWTTNGQDVLYHQDWILEHLQSSKKQPVRSARRRSSESRQSA
jgi:hypothetical protein